MSKSILVIDTPEGCYHCHVTQCEFDNMSKNRRPDNCPLVPMPERKQLSYDDWDYDLKAGEWNKCIDTIEKGYTETRSEKRKSGQQDRNSDIIEGG